MRFEKITGPACPKCGCQHAHEEGRSTFFGKEQLRLRCRFCGYGFRAAVESPLKPAAEVPKPYENVRCACPNCGQVNAPTTHTETKSGGLVIRSHKCRACGHTFKTNSELNSNGRKSGEIKSSVQIPDSGMK